MSNEIGKHHVQQFSSNLIHLLNQEGSQLMGTVKKENITGRKGHFERIGRGTVVKVTSRHMDTPINDTAHSRRTYSLEDFAWGDMIDKQDKIRMLVDPTSDYTKAAAWDLGEKMDKIILEALNGTAVSGNGETDAETNVVLPTSSIIDEDFGTGSDSNLTVEKLREARRRMMRHAGTIRDDLFIVVNASAIDSLLAETEVTSSDFNSVKALVHGNIDTFLGFKFIVVADGILPGTADGTDSDPVRCFAYQREGLGLGMGKDIGVEVYERGDKMNNIQVLSTMTLGAVRIEEARVQAIECVQVA